MTNKTDRGPIVYQCGLSFLQQSIVGCYFANPELSLAEIAAAVGISEKELSRLVNLPSGKALLDEIRSESPDKDSMTAFTITKLGSPPPFLESFKDRMPYYPYYSRVPSWRPRYEDVLQWRLAHPGGKLCECAAVSGYSTSHLSRITSSLGFRKRLMAAQQVGHQKA